MEKHTNELPQHWLDNPNILYHGITEISNRYDHGFEKLIISTIAPVNQVF